MNKLKQLNQPIKDFWIKQINFLKVHKGIPADFDDSENFEEKTWLQYLDEATTFLEVKDRVTEIAQYIYGDDSSDDSDDYINNERIYQKLKDDLEELKQTRNAELDLEEESEEDISIEDELTKITMEIVLNDYPDAINNQEEDLNEKAKILKVSRILVEDVLKYKPDETRDFCDRGLTEKDFRYWRKLKETLNGSSLEEIVRSKGKLKKELREKKTIIGRVENKLGLGWGNINTIDNIRDGKTLQELKDDSDNLTTVKGNLTSRDNEIRHALNCTIADLNRPIVGGKRWHVYQRELTDKLKTLLKHLPITRPNRAISGNWENHLIHKEDLGLAVADYGNVNTILGGKSLTQLRDDSDELTAIQARITATGKTLAQLITGGGGGNTLCSHTDYDSLKDQITTLTQENQSLQSERDQALKEKDQVLTEKEVQFQKKDQQIQSILQNLNTSLNLNLKDPTLEEIITKLQTLLQDPKVIEVVKSDTEQIESLKTDNQQLQQTIASLQTQLAQANEQVNNQNQENQTEPKQLAVNKENQEAVLRILKESNRVSSTPLYQEEINQIQQAQNAQQLTQSYQKVIDKGLTELKVVKHEKVELVQHQKTERIILISLLVISLVGISGLLLKLRKNQTKK